MGWYIGNQQVGQVTVETTDGMTTNEAYLGLQDKYALHRFIKSIDEVNVPYYSCEIVIGIWNNKQALIDGKNSLNVVNLNQSIFVEIPESEMIEELSGSILAFLVSKLIPAIEEIKTDWIGKLISDF